MLNMLLADKPIWQPADKAMYSDQAYILLGFALENITGKPYEDVIREKITQPLELKSTRYDLPAMSQAIIPVGMQVFDLDVGNFKS
jgi:CubicO group peptidase (beta-lactamase class C family)